MTLKIMLRCFTMLFLMQYPQFVYSATIYGANGSGIYSIDQITGQASILSSSFRGFGNEGVALEYTNSVLYGANGSGIYSIDQITGQASILSSSFRGFGNEGVALEYTNGILYGANGSGIYSIDQLTGQASILSSSFRGFGNEGVALISISSIPIPSSIWLFLSGGIFLTKVFRGKRNRWFGSHDYRA